jgi:hypothetical protein
VQYLAPGVRLTAWLLLDGWLSVASEEAGQAALVDELPLGVESVRFESDRFESDRFESDRFESDRFESDRFESDRFESVRFESVRFESDRFESRTASRGFDFRVFV